MLLGGIYIFILLWVFGFLVVFAVTDNAAVSIPTRCPRVTCWVDQPRWPGHAAVTVTLSGRGPRLCVPRAVSLAWPAGSSPCRHSKTGRWRLRTYHVHDLQGEEKATW